MLANYLLEKGWVSSGWAQLISYAIIFTAVLLFIRMLAKFIKSAMNVVMLGWADGFVGGLLYAFGAALIWSSLLWIGDRMHLISAEAKSNSKTYEYFIVLAPWVYAHLGVAIPFAKNVFNELSSFFEKID